VDRPAADQVDADPATLSRRVKEAARALGFDRCGIAEAGPLDPGPLRDWLAAGHAAGMAYMKENVEERLDPGKLMPGARSVVAVAINYYRPDPPSTPGTPHIARYARGRDYHLFLRRKVRKLRRRLLALAPGARVHPSVDTSPVMEKAWAERAGIGWVGKNGTLLTEEFGSYVLLGALVTDLRLTPDAPHPERCGSCSRCLPACPTGALLGDGKLDSRRCIAYWTIETREAIPVELREACADWTFGCDICQEVCPWNREAVTTQRSDFDPHPLTALRCSELARLSPERHATLAVGSPLRRPGLTGLRRNAVLNLLVQADEEARQTSRALADDPDPVVAEAAQWVSAKLQERIAPSPLPSPPRGRG
jgi:epoxyqueuosine reductase